MCYEKRKIQLEIEQDHQPPTVSKTSKQSEESKTSSSQKRGESQKHIDLFTKRGEDILYVVFKTHLHRPHQS